MNLEPFFNPKSLVIIGASRKEFTFNQTVLRNLLDIRFRGNIYIINPNTDELLGIRSYNNLSSLPEVPELAIIMLRNNLKDLFEELGKFGKIWVHEESMRLFAEMCLTVKNQNDELVCQITAGAAIAAGGY